MDDFELDVVHVPRASSLALRGLTSIQPRWESIAVSVLIYPFLNNLKLAFP